MFVHGFDRPNLRLAMRRKAGGRGSSLDFVTAHRGHSGIVYCGVAPHHRGDGGVFARRRSPALPYHAGMETAERGAQPGYLPAGGRRRHGGDDRVRHGHRQARRPFRAAMPICRTISRAITRRSAAPAATGCRPIRSRFTAPAIFACGACRSRTATLPTSKNGSTGSGSARWYRCGNRRAAGARPC